MGKTINDDGSVTLPTGTSHTTKHRNYVRVQFIRYDYVIYPGLGDNLDGSFLGFLSGLTDTASSKDFLFIEPDSPRDLNALFNVRSRKQIYPLKYQQFNSQIKDRWIYFFIEDGPGTLIELYYKDYQTWSAGVFEMDDKNGKWEQIKSYVSGKYDLFELDRRLLEDTYAIALPSQVNPETAISILVGLDVSWVDDEKPTRELCRLIPAAVPEGTRGVDMRIMIFDPGHLINHTVKVIEEHTQLMRVVDPRVRFTKITPRSERIRNKGILACLMKQLVKADSSLKDEVKQRNLNRSFNTYANYGFRKGYFIDNIYNFICHPIMKRLEMCLMDYKVDNQLIDGAIWLEMISPLAEIAGEHTLLTNYFLDAAENEPDGSAWATFFKSSLEIGTAKENSTVTTWKNLMSKSDYVSLAVGLSEAVTYKLVRDYTDGTINYNQFNKLFNSNKKRMENVARSLKRFKHLKAQLKKIDSAFKWGKKLGVVAAALKGDISASTLKTTLSEMSKSAEARKAATLAIRISFVVNAIDIVGNASDVRDRFANEDYDAAASYGVAVAAGVTEMAFIYAYGSAAAATGPVGIVLAIIGAMAAIVASLTTDSSLERFARHSIWGNEPHQSSKKPSWSATKISHWTDSDRGVKFQLAALMNLLHKYEVTHDFDDDTRKISIEIETKFFPDSALFVFRGDFVDSKKKTHTIFIVIRQPSRDSRRPSKLYSRRIDQPLYEFSRKSCGTARVKSDDGVHTIKISIRVDKNFKKGKGWISCQPFGHDEFTVPDDGRAFFLDDILSDSLFSSTHLKFEPDSFKKYPK